MAWVALTQVTVFLLVVFPGRALMRRRRTGRPVGRVDWSARRPGRWYVADAGFLGGFACVLAGAVLDGIDVVGPLFEAPPGLGAAGVAVGISALALVLWAQAAMGAAWRADIAPHAGADLVTQGPFALVRNPAYVAMLAVALGAVALSPGVVTAAGWALLLGGIMLTARVEEAELSATHGAAYRAYLARVGRFVPGVGRVPARPVADRMA